MAVLTSARWWLEDRRQPLLRAALVTGVLASSAYAGLRPGSNLIMILPAVAAFVVLLRWPAIGLMLVVPAALIVPFNLGTGTGTSINAVVLLLLAMFAVRLLRVGLGAEERSAWTGALLPLLALCGASVLSFLVGMSPLLAFAKTAPLAAQVGGLAIFLLSAIAFVLVAQQMAEEHWLRWMTWLFLGLGALFIARQLIPWLGGPTARLFQPGVNNSTLWIWIVALSFSQGVFNRRLALPWRLALVGLASVTLYLGWFGSRQWVSGWLPPLVAVVVTTWVARPKLGFLLAPAGIVLITTRFDALSSLVLVGDNQYSYDTRVEAWRIVLELVQASPLVGLGPANYYWYTPLYSILGYHLSFNSHNNYVDLFAQTGVLGLICFIWFAWCVGSLALRLRARVDAGFARAYVYGASGGLAAMLVAAMLGDWVIPFVYNVGMTGFKVSVLGWMFLGGLAALEAGARLHPRPQAEGGSGR